MTEEEFWDQAALIALKEILSMRPNGGLPDSEFVIAWTAAYADRALGERRERIRLAHRSREWWDENGMR